MILRRQPSAVCTRDLLPTFRVERLPEADFIAGVALTALLTDVRRTVFLFAVLRAVVFLADLRAVLRAVVFLAVDLRAVDLRAVVFLAVDLRAVFLFAVLPAVAFLAEVFLEADFFLEEARFVVLFLAVELRLFDPEDFLRWSLAMVILP